MDTPPPIPAGLIAWLHAAYGAAGTTLIIAAVGRLIYHGGEVRAGRRPLIGWHLLWEVPTAVGMAVVGEAVAAYFGLSHAVEAGIVGAASYIGPRGITRIVERAIVARGVK